MALLNVLIKSWKIQNIRLTKHYPFFKMFSNKSYYMSVIRILIQRFFQRKMNVLLFLRNKNYRAYAKFIRYCLCQQNEKAIYFLFPACGNLLIDMDYNS